MANVDFIVSFKFIAVTESSETPGLQTFLHSPEDITNTFITQPRNLLTMAHTNFLCHFSSIEHAVIAIDMLTNADVFLNEWRVSSNGV